MAGTRHLLKQEIQQQTVRVKRINSALCGPSNSNNILTLKEIFAADEKIDVFFELEP